jgi:O-antigen/teichoic acid export membrane protein
MFVQNVLLTYLTEVICAAVNFATGVLLARLLSPAERGVMVLVMTLPNLMFNLLNLGLHESTTFFVGRKKIADNQVLGNALVLVAAIGAVAFGVLALLRGPAVETFLQGLPPGLWLPVALLVPAALIQGILLSMLRAKMSFGRMNLWRLSATLAMLAGFGLALWAFGANLRTGVLVYFWLSLPLLAFTSILVRQVVSFRFRVQVELMRDLLGYGLKSSLQGIISGMNYRLDVFLVAVLLRSEDVAFYGVAFALAEIAWFLPNAAGTVLFPRLANASAAEVHQLTARASRVIFALTALTAAATALVAPLAPAVYGPAYWRSIPPLLILLPGILMMTLHKVLGRNFASRGRQQYTIIASLLSFLLILILDLVLIPRFGIQGAALASTAGYFAAGLALLAFYRRDAKRSAWEVVLIQPADITRLRAFTRQWLRQWRAKT